MIFTKPFEAVPAESNSAYKKYLSYSMGEREIMQVFAVAHRTVNLTQMVAIMKMIQKAENHPFTLQEQGTSEVSTQWNVRIKHLREKAFSDDLLVRVSNLFLCHDDIILLLIMETVEQGTFETIKKCAEAQVPYLYDKSQKPAQKNEVTLDNFRKIRMSLFSRDNPEFFRMSHFESYQYPLNGIRFYYFEGLSTPFYPHIFEHFTPQIRYLILAMVLQNETIDVVHQKTAVHLLKNLIGDIGIECANIPEHLQPASPGYLLAEQYALGGEFVIADKMLNDLILMQEKKRDISMVALVLHARIKCMQGYYDQAITNNQFVIAEIKKQSRKKNIAIPDINGIFYIIALLSRNEPSALLLAKQQIKFAIKESEDYEFRLFDELVKVLEGQKKVNECHLLSWERSDLDANFVLFWSLCHCWLRLNMSTHWLEALSVYSIAAKENGQYWYYVESQLILNRSKKALVDPDIKSQLKSEAKFKKSLSWKPLLDLIQPVPQWQRALTSLQKINQPDTLTGSTQAGQTKCSRLTWRIQFYANDCALHPREQILGKNNKWSAGRSVSLERLYEETESFDYLTDQDRQMCRYIESETEYQRYGRHQKVYYTASGLGLLKAAVGHPLLFLHDDPKQAIEFSQTEIVLEILSKKNQFTIKIIPFPETSEPYVVMHNGGNQAQLVELTPQHQRIIEIIGEQGITVPVKAKQQLLDTIQSIAPLMTIHSDFVSDSTMESMTKVDADCRPQVHIQPSEEGLLFECFVQPFSGLDEDSEQGPLFRPGHGRSIIMSEINGKSLQTQRDLDKEKEQAGQIIEQCPLLDEQSDWHWPLNDTEEALETLLQLQALKNHIQIKWPQGEKLKLKKQSQMKQMQVVLKKKKDWFELDGQLNLDDGQIIAMQDLFDLMQMSPGRFIQLNNGDFLALTDELKKRLSQLQFASNKKQIHALNAPLIDELTDGMSVKSGKHWQTLLQRAEQARTFEPEMPTTLQTELRDYQIDGFKWLARLAHWGAGACLADDMGLGKTLQSLALLLTRATQGTTLIIAPTSVCFNWIDEIQRFTPTLKVRHFASGQQKQVLDDLNAMDVVICSYGLLQAQAKRLTSIKWHTIIADEAQAFKNSQTKRSRAMMDLQADYRMILTGTPIENHLGELWNLFRFINPGLLGSLESFNKQFASPIENNQDKEAARRLKNLIKPFILRRLKTEVLTELPSRTEITVQVDMSDEEIALYEALRRKAVEKLAAADDEPGQKRFKILGEIMRLRRACCHPKLVMPEVTMSSSKLQAFAEIITELKENHHKALVFSQFVGHLTIIREFLDTQKIEYQYLDGSTSHKKRKMAIDAFQAGQGDVFLISLKAGGSGLNLTAADYVIHMDPWWNPAVEDQASDRAHRMGQTRPVTIYRLVTRNTIESKIVQLHQQKRELADNLLEGSEMSGKMSLDDMYNLISQS